MRDSWRRLDALNKAIDELWAPITNGSPPSYRPCSNRAFIFPQAGTRRGSSVPPTRPTPSLRHSTMLNRLCVSFERTVRPADCPGPRVAAHLAQAALWRGRGTVSLSVCRSRKCRRFSYGRLKPPVFPNMGRARLADPGTAVHIRSSSSTEECGTAIAVYAPNRGGVLESPFVSKPSLDPGPLLATERWRARAAPATSQKRGKWTG